MMRYPFLIAAALAATTAAAQVAPTEPAPGEQQATECPDFIRGAQLKTTNVDGGVAFVITTDNKKFVAPLRDMVRQMGDVVEKQSAESANQPQQQVALPPLDVNVREVPSGARVVVKAERTEDVASLRTQAQKVEQLWKSSRCVNGEATAEREALP